MWQLKQIAAVADDAGGSNGSDGIVCYFLMLAACIIIVFYAFTLPRICFTSIRAFFLIPTLFSVRHEGTFLVQI